MDTYKEKYFKGRPSVADFLCCTLEVLLFAHNAEICHVFYVLNEESNKSSKLREKWKFLLFTPISIFKVFM